MSEGVSGGRITEWRRHPIECFETARARADLRARGKPYHLVLGPCVSLGFYRYVERPPKWFARYRNLNGKYLIKDLGLAEELHASHDQPTLTFLEARVAALAWFDTPEVKAVSGRGDNYLATGSLCVCPVGDAYTVSHALADYLAWRKSFGARHSQVGMVCQANRYIIPVIGSIPCDQLTATDVRLVPLMVERTERGFGPKVVRQQIDPDSLSPEERRRRRVTANHVLNLLKWALRSAFDEGRISNEVAWRAVKGFRHVDKNRVEYLSWTQAKRLVGAARPDLRLLILAGLYTGCRVSELYRITVGDLLEERMALYVHAVKSYRGRTIALPDEGYQFFKALAHGKGKQDPLLTRQNGLPWTTNYLSAVFRPLARCQGLPDTFVFHCIRHTYASLLLQAGTPPIVVARQLGHLNMLTVIKTYSHVVDDFYDNELRQRFKPNFLSEPGLFEGMSAGTD